MSKAAAEPRSLPKTTILSITTHGEIRLNREITSISDIVYDRDGIATVLPTFDVNPRIREFYKFNAVVPGVLSYVAGDNEPIDIKEIERISRREGGYEAFDLLVGEDVAAVNRDIRDIIAKTPAFDRIPLDGLAREIAQTVTTDIENVLTNIKSWRQGLEQKKRKGPLTEDEIESLKFYTEFINNYDKASNLVNCLEKGRKMVNKTFVLTSDDRAPTSEDWSITSLNDPFNVRKAIFDEVYNTASSVARSSARQTSRRSITLEQIVNYLAANGVERLIIIDLTCCPILGPYVDDPDAADTEYVGRNVRQLRRGVLGNIGYGGKKSRRSRRRKRSTKRKRRRTYKK